MSQCASGDCSFAERFLLPIAESFEVSPLANWVNGSLWIVPWAGAAHLVFLGLLGGAVLLVDMRALGTGTTSVSAQNLNRTIMPIFVLALIGMFISGTILGFGEVLRLYHSVPYWLKMATLFSAIVFTLFVRNPALNPEKGLGPISLGLGGLSVVIWLGVFVLLANSLAWGAAVVIAAAFGLFFVLAGRSGEGLGTPARIISILNLMMWFTVAISGRWIAFY